MRRRALLAALASGAAASAAGCVRAPGSRPPVPDPDADAALAVTDFDVTTEKVAPDYRWLVRITGVYSTDAVGRHFTDPVVVDVADIDDPEIRDAVERTLRDGEYRTNSIPDGLRDFVARTDLVTWAANTAADATATHWSLGVFDADPGSSPAVQFDARVTDSGVSADDPAAIEFSLTNVGGETYAVFSGTVPPFSLLNATRPSDLGSESPTDFLLWNDRYADDECVGIQDDRLVVCAIGVRTPIEPGETITREYAIDPAKPRTRSLGPGDWTISDTLTYHREGEAQGPSTEVEWRVDFTLEDVETE